jgi:integrase
MHGIPYLTKRRGIFFFRRRVPGLSTCLSPVMLSMGTTDRRSAFRLCVQLTAQMDRMLDTDTHINLPDAEVTAFFQAELRRVLASLRAARVMERMDGSLTADRALEHRLEAYALRSLVVDGLRDEMPDDRVDNLPEAERAIAVKIHSNLFREFMSPGFNQKLLYRAQPSVPIQDLSEHEKLLLRWATVEAQMAAHDALEKVPLHRAEEACHFAEELLRRILSTSAFTHDDGGTAYQAGMAPMAVAFPALTAAQPDVSAPVGPCLTPGVALISGRITAHALYAQRDAANSQPKDLAFQGEAESAVVERVYGQDLFGTAVRMCRKQQIRQGTKDQKLKTVALFSFTTGIQLVTDIRSHHIDMFADALKKLLIKSYWKSPRSRELTFREMRTASHAARPDEIGLARPSIDRHLTTLKSIMAYAAREGHHVPFEQKIAELLPVDDRSDDEKRSVFTLDDVQEVFSQPLWSGSKSRTHRHNAGPVVVKDQHYWINIALALTGARRGEIAGLLTTDILEEDGIHFAYIRPNHLRGLKKKHCKRRVPLHPQLIELGFLEFVDGVRQRGKKVIFIEAVPAHCREDAETIGDIIAPYDDKFGDVLDYMWRKCLNKSFPGNPENYTLHNLRHYANDTLINIRGEDGMRQLVNDIDRRDLMGHKPIDVNEGTYRRHEKPLRPIFEAVKFLPRLEALHRDK